jgi:drug/metabolite transporter (DMT)-like permease
LKIFDIFVTRLPYGLRILFKNSAVVYLTVGAAIISFSGVWVKIADVTPTMAGFYRVFFGAIFFLCAAAWKRQIKWKGWGYMALGLLVGFFLALDLFLWHTSIQYIGPGLATILGNFEVFLLAAVGVLFLGEKLSLKFLFAIIMAIAGLFLIVGLQWNQFGNSYKTGVYLGLATAVAYTAYLLGLRRLQSGQEGIPVFYSLMLVSFTTAFFLSLKALHSADSFVIPSAQSWIALLLLGLASHGIGWFLITTALPRVRASFVGLILLLQPSLAFIWDVIFFQRNTSFVNWIGVIIVLSAIYLGMTRSSADG